MRRVGLEFRATKDLDIVLCIEALDTEFAKAFWRFVTAGGYLDRGQGDASKQYYRFQHPSIEVLPLDDDRVVHAPAGPLWTPGRLDHENQCISTPALSPSKVLSSGGVLCYTDPYFAAIILGTEETVARVPMYQEAFLREHGEEPRTFRALEFLFHRRGDGMVTGLAVFRPLLPRYVPLFQALAVAEPKDD